MSYSIDTGVISQEDEFVGHGDYACMSRMAELDKQNAAKDKQLKELAEAADKMLELLVDNKPIDGLWSGDIDEWDQLIKEGKKL